MRVCLGLDLRLSCIAQQLPERLFVLHLSFAVVVLEEEEEEEEKEANFDGCEVVGKR